MTRGITFFPPKHVMSEWHKAGLSPDEIYRRCKEFEDSLPLGLKRRMAGGRKLLPIGCAECKRKHYAKGFCQKCYGRWYYRVKMGLAI